MTEMGHIGNAPSDMTGMHDANNTELKIGDRIIMLGMTGIVAFKAGAYGVIFDEKIDKDHLTQAVKNVTKVDYPFKHLANDSNFLSFWEIVYNFDAQDDYLNILTMTHRP